MPEAYSLYELNEEIKEAIAAHFSQPIWIRAEISEIRENSNGHCYLELVEKDEKSDRIIAKNKATIWSFTYRMLKPYFETSTGQTLHEGLRILISCTVEYHELYGLSLNISDIDPTYTLGELALRRQQILQQLQADGIADMNKELTFPEIPQRIAIISSGTAAGYGDFLDQLHHNEDGFIFYTHLFQSIMQGDKTEQSLIHALDRVYENIHLFDVVVIIRGGGASADLSCFDRYLLAVHCAQFPLPILTGIGHQRDSTILDTVAFNSLKTPTAVAEYLIDTMQDAYGLLSGITDRLTEQTRSLLEHKENLLKAHTQQIPQLLSGRTESQKFALEKHSIQLKQFTQVALKNKQYALDQYQHPLKHNAIRMIQEAQQIIEQKSLQLQYTNPLSLLKKGYTLTYKNGKRVTSSKDLQPGDHITSVFADGTTSSTVSDK